MKKTWINFICIVLCILIPIVAVMSVGFIIPTQFDKTFIGELKYKVDRLDSITAPKVVIIGGSSVPFGIDSKLLEEKLGMPVVNFGLYATLGTKLMLDLSEKSINKGDIIVIAPETDPQTYSLYFNAESAWQACDEDFSLLSRISFDNFPDMLGGFWKFTAQKIKYSSGEHLDPAGVYNVASFDEYGDIIYPRPANTGFLGQEVVFNPEKVISDEFVDYVNDYTKYAQKKGAKVFFSFAPTNIDAVNYETYEDDCASFAQYVSEKFTAKVISSPSDFVYDSEYFFDTNFHLNDEGMKMHTLNLAQDIAEAMKSDTPDDPSQTETTSQTDATETTVQTDVTETTTQTDITETTVQTETTTPVVPLDENEKYFTFGEMKSKGVVTGYSINGTTDLGKEQTVLHTPLIHNGLPVRQILPYAFEDCTSLTDIYVDPSIASLIDGAFGAAPALQRIHLSATEPDTVSTNALVSDPFDGLCLDMNRSAVFCVPAEAYNAYLTSYFWMPYSSVIRAE